ncbi:MAG: YkgJ family cysteine cluster protein [Candidatus Njordarchaeales archaeon]
MGILDGKHCLENKCYKCCLDTEMILTMGDLIRLLIIGVNIEKSIYYDGEYWRLKNVNNRCVFLTDEGLCEIYDNRPLGCQAYPIVMGFFSECVPDDEVCPYVDLLSKEEIEKGCQILKNFFKELGEKPPRGEGVE